ncbi:hypothetical protein HYH03_005483 [Edaphochlamys debaryana]|uniref:Patatin n=1 Tax=Edaphochlamys debaryana TaxID=47281 RepID=A0A836C2G5_9CHLO|nr:hypothetical protein HYH03_005483 [Edaphochlamys debaryana]|eukprot:KAG2496663.1 hypothetical protein HYH03_005483 [Edaphochlamys debaryana]
MQSEDVSSDVGFGFSAGGLLFPYFLGVVSQLQAMGVLRHEVPVAGASAGSIIAVCAKSGLSEEQLFEALLDLAADCRQGGTRARLRHVLHRVLDSVLPADIHERCEGRAFLAVTNVWPRPQSELVSSFSSRDDLIDTVLTSCHIPYWFDGSLVRPYRNSIAFDGGITNFIPATPTDICHRVCCFPSANLSSFSIDLSPDTFDSDFPYDMRTLLSWAFEPAPDAMLAALLERGKRDARAWALANVPSSQLVMAA